MNNFKKLIISFFALISHIPFILFKNKFVLYRPQIIGHSNWKNHLLSDFDFEENSVLEIGSRSVTKVNSNFKFSKAKYKGLDISNGINVDVICDAHEMSEFLDGEKFDLVFSSYVFEHLHSPWIVVDEIKKILKPGGSVFIETHFSYSFHGGEHNYFQFSHHGLRALFSQEKGFSLIDYGMDTPMIGYTSYLSDRSLRFQRIYDLYYHSMILIRYSFKD